MSIINVEDFGAVGDGVTDDTAAIQAALDEAVRAGHDLVMEAGTYRITQPLVGVEDATGRIVGVTFVRDEESIE